MKKKYEGVIIADIHFGSTNITHLKRELEEVQAEKEEVVAADSTEDYQKAADLKTKECILNDRLEELNKNLQLKALTVQDIAEVIESWTKIPVTKITEAETQKLLNLVFLEM